MGYQPVIFELDCKIIVDKFYSSNTTKKSTFYDCWSTSVIVDMM